MVGTEAEGKAETGVGIEPRMACFALAQWRAGRATAAVVWCGLAEAAGAGSPTGPGCRRCPGETCPGWPRLAVRGKLRAENWPGWTMADR
jgi:hypothetical protein